MKRFVVIGLGRFGKKLAIALAMSGAEVIAIDKQREEIDLIRDQVSLAVRLDSTDEEALKAQGIDKVDVAIIGIGQGTGSGFESAILTVVNLKQMGVPLIYARAEDLIAGEVFSKIDGSASSYFEAMLLAPLPKGDEADEQEFSKNDSSVVIRFEIAANSNSKAFD